MNGRDYLQLSSHQAFGLVANHFTALVGAEGGVEGSLDLRSEFIIRNLPPARMFPSAAAGGAAIARRPRGSRRSWLG